MLSASFPQPDWFLNKIIATSAAQFFDVSSFYREQAAGVWSVFVDAAQACAVGVLLEERTLEKQFAASAAAVAFAPSQGKRLNHLLLAKVCVYQAADLTLGLPRTQLGILNRTRMKPVRQPLFEGALP
jgi:hypothetical protein